jgi:hypothetical protein
LRAQTSGGSGAAGCIIWREHRGGLAWLDITGCSGCLWLHADSASFTTAADGRVMYSNDIAAGSTIARVNQLLLLCVDHAQCASVAKPPAEADHALLWVRLALCHPSAALALGPCHVLYRL